MPMPNSYCITIGILVIAERGQVSSGRQNHVQSITIKSMAIQSTIYKIKIQLLNYSKGVTMTTENCIRLANGGKMPVIGLGTWLADDETQLSAAVESALDAGYRHFDTAFAYGNERVLGNVLRKWVEEGKGTREELFIVTKLPICGMRADKVAHFLSLSLQNLGLDYVDLYLVHVPFGVPYTKDDQLISIGPTGKVVIDTETNIESIWRAMEAQVRTGPAKAIGVSNFDQGQLERVLAMATIRPGNLQVELHAYFQQKELRAFCAREGIAVSAYAPFASPGRGDFYQRVGLKFEALNPAADHLVLKMAKKHDKTPWQLLLRFLIQQGVAVLPKSVNPGRIRDNFDVLGFVLSGSEMRQLEELDKGAMGRTFRFEFLPGIEAHPEFPKSMKL